MVLSDRREQRHEVTEHPHAVESRVLGRPRAGRQLLPGQLMLGDVVSEPHAFLPAVERYASCSTSNGLSDRRDQRTMKRCEAVALRSRSMSATQSRCSKPWPPEPAGESTSRPSGTSSRCPRSPAVGRSFERLGSWRVAWSRSSSTPPIRVGRGPGRGSFRGEALPPIGGFPSSKPIAGPVVVGQDRVGANLPPPTSRFVT